MLALLVGSATHERAAFLAAWLKRHHVTIDLAADEFAACARLFTEPERVPDLICLDANTTGSAGTILRSYIHETWPGAVLVCCAAPANGEAEDGRTVFLESTSQWNRLLSQTPAEFVQASHKVAITELSSTDAMEGSEFVERRTA